ncbi:MULTISPECIES: hypothetical protein [Lelliottia]|jgi:hypothetical protein|uniref:hypothetical protein n=1 Tax=Lelliottia TaxID=1330545 RepID=UPI00200FEE86|nr:MULTISPECIES: hypothetical protein [Lelliottia]MDH6632858.1 hypothetical protein [Lelliottia amnigena]UQC71092.1 hypothetical protein C0560_09915 [Lelliottia sp. AC1]
MVIALLDNREEYEQWYMQIICSEENTEYPSLLNAHEIETALGENLPLSFPCLAYRQKNEFNCLDEEIVYIYEEEFSKWIDRMGKVKRPS